MPGYRLILDGAAMDELLRGPTGPVMQNGNRVGDAIIARARTKINRRTQGPTAAGASGITLANTLVKRWAVGERGPELSIVAMADYAYWVHEGNKSNRGDGRIWPTRSTNNSGTGPPMLRFVAPGGGFIFARSVKESTPNPFLREAMEEIVPLG